MGITPTPQISDNAQFKDTMFMTVTQRLRFVERTQCVKLTFHTLQFVTIG